MSSQAEIVDIQQAHSLFHLTEEASPQRILIHLRCRQAKRMRVLRGAIL
jgi:hypothetical protein